MNSVTHTQLAAQTIKAPRTVGDAQKLAEAHLSRLYFEDMKEGMYVAYIPCHANFDINHPDVEWGTVSSIHKHTVFVRFDEDVRRNGWSDAQGKAVAVHMLILAGSPVAKHYIQHRRKVTTKTLASTTLPSSHYGKSPLIEEPTTNQTHSPLIPSVGQDIHICAMLAPADYVGTVQEIHQHNDHYLCKVLIRNTTRDVIHNVRYYAEPPKSEVPAKNSIICWPLTKEESNDV